MLSQIQAFLTQHSVIVFYLAGFGGMLAHYVKKWAKGEYQGNLWAYLYGDNPKSSLMAIITFAGAAAGVVSTGTLDAMHMGTITGLGFTTGYTIDSSINSTKI